MDQDKIRVCSVFLRVVIIGRQVRQRINDDILRNKTPHPNDRKRDRDEDTDEHRHCRAVDDCRKKQRQTDEVRDEDDALDQIDDRERF